MDASLETSGGLAKVATRGYRICDGILMHRAEDPNGEVCDCVVLPKCERKRVLELAHDRMGHVDKRG